LNIGEDRRVRKKYKWMKSSKEEECRRPTGAIREGRKKIKVERRKKKKIGRRGEQKLLNPFLKLLKT
jgi:hypothetical protein